MHFPTPLGVSGTTFDDADIKVDYVDVMKGDKRHRVMALFSDKDAFYFDPEEKKWCLQMEDKTQTCALEKQYDLTETDPATKKEYVSGRIYLNNDGANPSITIKSIQSIADLVVEDNSKPYLKIREMNPSFDGELRFETEVIQIANGGKGKSSVIGEQTVTGSRMRTRGMEQKAKVAKKDVKVINGKSIKSQVGCDAMKHYKAETYKPGSGGGTGAKGGGSSS